MKNNSSKPQKIVNDYKLLNSNNNSFYKKTINIENNKNLDIIIIKNNISKIMKELKDANINQTKSDISDIKTKVEGINMDIKDIKDELFEMKNDIKKIKNLLFEMFQNNQFNNDNNENCLYNKNKQNNIKTEGNIKENKYFKSTKKEKIITINFNNKNHFIKLYDYTFENFKNKIENSFKIMYNEHFKIYYFNSFGIKKFISNESEFKESISQNTSYYHLTEIDFKSNENKRQIHNKINEQDPEDEENTINEEKYKKKEEKKEIINHFASCV